MATNKTAIENKIEDIETGVLNPAQTVREVLKYDDNSFLEALYSDSDSDSHIAETHTTSNSNFTYDIDFNKVGSDVILTGKFSALASVGSASLVFEVTDTNYISDANIYHSVATKYNNSIDFIPIYIVDGELKISADIILGEKYNFTITFKSLN